MSVKTTKSEQTHSGSPEHDFTVGVLRGGSSREREVSLETGQAVVNALEGRPCRVLEYDTSVDLGDRLESDDVDVVFVALHGKGGEDGSVQALLEWRNIDYTGPGPQASALCMDKVRTRQVFDTVDVPSPDWFRIRPGDPVENQGNFDRMVVKPRYEGSSLGMSIVGEEDLEDAVADAREFDEDVLVEEYVDGYELTVGAFVRDSLEILPPVGINPDHEFFDYETKYTKGLTEYDVPAELSSTKVREVQELTERIVREAETESLCRVDYLLDDEGTFHLLEINTIPGLTETSLLPKAARESGVSFEELVWTLVNGARRDSKCPPR